MEPVLALQGVWLSYPRGRRHVVRVLADVSLELHAGESVTVLARRSQGKTALLRIAAGVERPDRGSVRYAGQEIGALSDRHRARLLSSQVALVERAAPQLDVPVLTGVALPLLDRLGRREAYAQAERALADVGAGECAGQHWAELADSERALVALAQGIAREPRLLLVDDLTASLGLEEHAELAGLLGALAHERQVAVLRCASDSGARAGSDRVATLSGGELLASAPAPRSPEGNVIDFPGEDRHRASS